MARYDAVMATSDVHVAQHQGMQAPSHRWHSVAFGSKQHHADEVSAPGNITSPNIPQVKDRPRCHPFSANLNI